MTEYSKLEKSLKYWGALPEKAVMRLLGDHEFYYKMLKSFLASREFDDIENAIRKNDRHELFMAAHSLKGASATLGLESMKELSHENLMIAREKLIDELYSWQGYTGQKMILVFDGYRQKDSIGSSYDKGTMKVVYTRADETADAWIEREVYEHAAEYDYIVATSDDLIQNSIFAMGAMRMSARQLEEEVMSVKKMFLEK